MGHHSSGLHRKSNSSHHNHSSHSTADAENTENTNDLKCAWQCEDVTYDFDRKDIAPKLTNSIDCNSISSAVDCNSSVLVDEDDDYHKYDLVGRPLNKNDISEELNFLGNKIDISISERLLSALEESRYRTIQPLYRTIQKNLTSPISSSSRKNNNQSNKNNSSISTSHHNIVDIQILPPAESEAGFKPLLQSTAPVENDNNNNFQKLNNFLQNREDGGIIDTTISSPDYDRLSAILIEEEDDLQGPQNSSLSHSGGGGSGGGSSAMPFNGTIIEEETSVEYQFSTIDTNTKMVEENFLKFEMLMCVEENFSSNSRQKLLNGKVIGGLTLVELVEEEEGTGSQQLLNGKAIGGLPLVEETIGGPVEEEEEGSSSSQKSMRIGQISPWDEQNSILQNKSTATIIVVPPEELNEELCVEPQTENLHPPLQNRNSTEVVEDGGGIDNRHALQTLQMLFEEDEDDVVTTHDEKYPLMMKNTYISMGEWFN